MKPITFALAFTAAAAFAQTNPVPAQRAQPGQQTKPAPTKPEPAPPPKETPTPQADTAKKERPLTSLPYTPSLDIASMDRSANPCDGFYQYVCGGWIKNNPIPPDQAAWSVYGKLGDENARFLWGILEEAGKPDASRNAVQQKIGDYFESCMDEQRIEQLGATPLKPVLDSIDALKTKSKLATFLATEHLRNYSSGWLFRLGSD